MTAIRQALLIFAVLIFALVLTTILGAVVNSRPEPLGVATPVAEPTREGRPLATLTPGEMVDLARPTATVGAVCQYVGALASPTCTPGAINRNPDGSPVITQENLGETSCRPGGYTKSIRPPADYTTRLKAQQLAAGYAVDGDTDPSHVEEDHRLALASGGAPRDVQNLSPQPHHLLIDGIDWGSGAKDRIEAELFHRQCLPPSDPKFVTLAEAQRVLLGDWVAGYIQYIGQPVRGAVGAEMDGGVVDEDDDPVEP